MKKFLAILISAILLIGLVPMTVFADDDEDKKDPTSSITYSYIIDQIIGSLDQGNTKVDISYTLSTGEAISSEGTTDLTINIHNKGKAMLNTTLELTTPPEVTIQSGSTKREISLILPGETKKISFPLICNETIKEGSYPFAIKASGSVSQYPDAFNLVGLIADFANNNGDAALAMYLSKFNPNPFATADTFYVPVTVEGGGAYTTPRLMLTNYNCGGNVVAGSNFGLGLTFRNTSKEDLCNIKVTIDTPNFVPVGSSNSFFVDCIKAGESYSKTVTMSCAKDLPQKQYAVAVNTEYEDASGKGQSESDQISIPVLQETRLVVDDILDPGWLTMSDTGYANVTYRNMGNNIINNLTIKVNGDFTVEGANVYYVGNLASGKSDSYSFSFYPEAEGNCHGTVVFTYEDAEGYEHHIDKEFNFNIGPAYEWDDPGYDEPIEEGSAGLPLWAKIAIPVAAVVLLIVVISAIKKHKAKKQEALDLDE